MQTVSKQPAIIRLPHFGYIVGGIALVVLSLTAEPYLHRFNTYVIIATIALGLLMVEGTLLSVLYHAFISKKSRLNQLSNKNRLLAFVVIIITFIWSLMLFEISKGVYFSVFAHKI